jgi:hypothetical protein
VLSATGNAGNGASGSESRLRLFGEGLRRAPSQKELALILNVTTRHLRRWENAEATENRPCSRPYTHADLWNLYQQRNGKGWDRCEATRLGLADVFGRFDQMLGHDKASATTDEGSMLARMMLRSIVSEDDEGVTEPSFLSRGFGAGLAVAAKSQLRMIVNSDRARDVLVKAFLEAALIAEAKRSECPSD